MPVPHTVNQSQTFLSYSCSFKVATAPDGAEACSLDIEAAYRTTPVLPSHKRAMAVTHRGKFFVEHCVTFGVASAHGLQGEIADGTIAIWKKKGVGPFAKWVDDIVTLRFPSPAGAFASSFSHHMFDYDRSSALARIAHLGVPWHRSKGQDFSPIFQFVGFVFSLLDRSVTISDEKRLKNKGRVDSALAMFAHARMSLKDIQKLFGSLSHLTFVYLNMRSFLPPLSQFASSFSSNPHASRYPPPSVISSLRAWAMVLASPAPLRSLTPKGPALDIDLWVDASTSWGVGIVLGQKWIAWKLIPHWQSTGHDIGWLETLAVELAALLLTSLNYHDCHLLLRSDNQGVIGAHDRGRSRNFESNLSIRRTGVTTAAANISLSLVYVPSDVNRADPISRGILGSGTDKVPCHILLPDEIAPYFVVNCS